MQESQRLNTREKQHMIHLYLKNNHVRKWNKIRIFANIAKTVNQQMCISGQNNEKKNVMQRKYVAVEQVKFKSNTEYPRTFYRSSRGIKAIIFFQRYEK